MEFRIQWFKREGFRWNEALDHTVRSLDFLCRSLMDRTYFVNKTLDKVTHVGLGFLQRPLRRGRTARVVVGFCLVRELRSAWHIEMLCSRGYGSRLLQNAEARARAHGRSRVVLAALPHVVNYYRKLGYSNHTRLCHDDRAVQRFLAQDRKRHREAQEKQQEWLAKEAENQRQNEANLARWEARGGKKPRLLPTYYKSAHTALPPLVTSLKFATPSDAHRHKRFKQFLRVLIHNHLTANPTCGSVDQCKVDGYLMVKCLKRTPGKW